MLQDQQKNGMACEMFVTRVTYRKKVASHSNFDENNRDFSIFSSLKPHEFQIYTRIQIQKTVKPFKEGSLFPASATPITPNNHPSARVDLDSYDKLTHTPPFALFWRADPSELNIKIKRLTC